MTLCEPWITSTELGDCGCVTTPPTPAVLESSIQVASEVLYALSGGVYPGVCEGLVRPCGDACRCNFTDCGCNRLPKAFLRRDVIAVSEVDIAGEILDASAYRLQGSYLVRLDGNYWPCCQDLSAEPGAADTFTVTLTYGAAPPQMGIEAAKILASELVRACTPGETCALPARVTAITRQGVSMALLDPFDFLDSGRTGLYSVDLFLSTVNPQGLRSRSSAWSPDLPTSLTFPAPVS